MNSVTIIGHLGNDPEPQKLDGDRNLVRMSVATNERWTQNGDRRERTDWHRVVAFGRLAEICDDWLSQGSHVAIRGKLRTSNWEDDDGNNRRSVEIHAREVEFLDKASDAPAGEADDVGF